MSPREMTPEQAERAIRGVLAGIRDLRPLWPRVVTWTRGKISDQFKSEGGAGGEVWDQLSPRYAEWKQIHYPGRGILVATGKMKAALTSPSREATPDTLTLTFDKEHADLLSFHEGKERPRTKVPRRSVLAVLPPPVGVSVTAQNELDRIAEGYVDDLVRRMGLD